MEDTEQFGKKLNIGRDQIRSIKMLDEEKTQILERVLSSKSSKPIESPYQKYSFVSFFRYRSSLYYLATFYLVVLLGGGAVFAAERSLPGGTFYSLKVGVVEPLGSTFIFSPVGKIKYAGSLATKRMREAEVLADRGLLDQSKEDKINDLLVTHKEVVNEAAQEFREKNLDGVEDDLITDFQASMNAHARILEVINEDNKKEESSPATATKEAENGAKISEVARDAGSQMREILENKDEKTEEKYEQRKEAVKYLIDLTLEELNISKDLAPEDQQTILEDVELHINLAQQLLKEADEEMGKGDSEIAYEKLLDSQTSAKEASILVKNGFKSKDESPNEE